MNTSFHRFTQRSFSSNSNFLNKQNEQASIKYQKNIYETLQSLNSIIIKNNNQINQLHKKIDSIEAKTKNTQINNQMVLGNEKSCIEESINNEINETKLTLHKESQKIILQNQMQQKFDDINKRVDGIILQMKRKQNQNLYGLQKRLSEKGEKKQIQKAVNLSKLLAIEINLIQQRFKQNEKVTKNHEQKINHIEQELIQLKQNHSLNGKKQIKNYQKYFVQNFNQTHLQNLKLDFLIQLQTIEKQTDLKINQIRQYLQTNQTQTILTTQIHSIFDRLITLQSLQAQEQQTHSIFDRLVALQSHQALEQQENLNFNKQIQNRINQISRETQSQNAKVLKDSEVKVTKKFQAWEKLYTKRTDFLSNIQKIQNSVNRLKQSIQNINKTLIVKTQKLQQQYKSLSSFLQQATNNFNRNLSRLQIQQNSKISELTQSVQNELSNYAKTQYIKNYLQLQNSKVHQIINNNFQQQKIVNQLLCSENILGRWLWREHELKGGNLISWDKEVINTLPQNFKYSPQNSNLIEIINAGIYRFQLGFYSKKKPTIQILINGKTVISAVNSSSYVIHHSSGRLKGIQPTQMSGLTLVDFFLIPQNSRIAISYNGDSKGEGFLNIHRF